MVPALIGGSGSFLLGLLNRMMISSWHTSTNTPRYNVSPATWASPSLERASPFKLTDKINQCVCCMLICFSCVQLLETPWTIPHKATLSKGFSRQEYWSGLPFVPPGDLPAPGFEPKSLMSPALADRFFTTSTTWEPAHLAIQGVWTPGHALHTISSGLSHPLWPFRNLDSLQVPQDHLAFGGCSRQISTKLKPLQCV